MQGVSERMGRERRGGGAVCMRREAWRVHGSMAKHGSGVLGWAVRHSFWRAMAAISAMSAMTPLAIEP